MYLHLISREKAAEVGLAYYFTGKPCRYGRGIANRRVDNKRCMCAVCVERRLELHRKYYHRHPERMRARYINSYDKRRAGNTENQRKYRSKNRDKDREQTRLWREKNPEGATLHSARRRASVIQRLPSWSGEFDDLAFVEAKKLARLRSDCTGMSWHVDHMIPLAAKEASGFHCGLNLQVIPKFLNLTKNNRFWLVEPDEWLAHI